jgi:hypothetical protein
MLLILANLFLHLLLISLLISFKRINQFPLEITNLSNSHYPLSIMLCNKMYNSLPHCPHRFTHKIKRCNLQILKFNTLLRNYKPTQQMHTKCIPYKSSHKHNLKLTTQEFHLIRCPLDHTKISHRKRI